MSNRSLQHAREDEIQVVDPVWHRIRQEAEDVVKAEPALSSFIFSTILSHRRLENAVIHRIVDRLHNPALDSEVIRQAYREALESDPFIATALRADIIAVADRDPACDRYIDPILYFKGFQAIQTHRLAHWLWMNGREDFALYLQSVISEVFQVDIHPKVRVGKGIFLDHATGVVIGGTAVLEDDVSILQGVTLGGTGKEGGDRHPKIRRGVLIGAGAKVLGNIEIGHCSRVASGSVVLKDVPANSTVAGVPAKIVGQAGCAEPSRSMNQMLGDGI
ncbi:serine O-acetyltransferase [Cohaesibacter gelatinilyticus]|uniref:Serine acetyltransferase n=1 Tax=Cohaesibacter gelatinilyticus TaxID=372072 RepID=A0A285NGU6_9HYPH|nr:serine O-acetyltransferase [Cohaesibacter gelatinilyticus]SNZ08498.1 serine O-acetyltransferase [Cohaesibacter gelatinilyticus]HAT87565.1 serine O-acetyltransferase [Hyphomicrobiales bacterium]